MNARKMRAVIATLSCGTLMAAGLTAISAGVAGAEESPTQKLSTSVKLLPQGQKNPFYMEWALDDPSQDSLKFNSQGEFDAAGDDLSSVTVTLTDNKGTAVVSGDGTQNTWRRAMKGLPAAQNFGVHDFEYGTYSVVLTENVHNWAIVKNTDSFESNPQKPIFWKSTLDVTGNIPNKFVLLGYDADNDGVADVEDTCASTPAGAKVDEHGCPLSHTGSYADTAAEVGVKVSSAAPKFDDTTTAAKEEADAPTGSQFALGNGAPEGATVDATTGVVTYTPKDGDAGKTVAVPVVVTYPSDGGSENLTANFVVEAIKDGDGDGVADDADKCAETPKGAEIDAEGCTMAQRYAPNYELTEATVDVEATSKAPTFDDVTTAEAENLPYNRLVQNFGDPTHETVAATFAIAQGGADGTDTAKVAVDGAVTWTLAAAGKADVPVNISYPDDSADLNASAPFNATKASSQPLTMSIKLLLKGKTDKSGIVQVSSDGDDTSQKELVVDGADLSVVTVTLTDAAGTSYVSGDKSSWTGTKDYPATQNFGLHKFEYGTYQVAIAADVDHWALIKNTDDFESNPQKPIFWKSTLDVDGTVANKFVLLGYDADNDGVADVEDKCSDTAAGVTVDADGCTLAQRYVPNYEITKSNVGVEATSKVPTFDDVTTPEKETLSAEKVGKVTFEIAQDGPAGTETAKVAADGAVTWKSAKQGKFAIPVNITYPDGSVASNTPAEFEITSTGSGGPASVVDSDGDGVPNKLDKCPGTRPNAKVDVRGCEVTEHKGKKQHGKQHGKQVIKQDVKSSLAKTGLDLMALSLIALTATAAGAVAMRRRREI